MVKDPKRLATLIAITILGFIAFVIPTLGSRPYGSLLAIYDRAVDDVGPVMWALMFVLGCVVGGLVNERPLVAGLASVALLPLFAFVEMFKDPTSHNLFPIEFAFYALWGLITALGVTLVQRIRKALK